MRKNNLLSETKMEYLSRGFKSVLGNQQAGSQASAHETVRLDVILSSNSVVFPLCDLIFLIVWQTRLSGCVTVWLRQHFWKIGGMPYALSNRFLR